MPGGKENLRVPTSAEAREIGRKGGVASGAARRRKASITAAIDACLQGKVTDEELVQELKQQGLTGLTNADAIALKMIAKAKTGDVEAARFVRDTHGEKPSEHHTLVTLDAGELSAADLSALSSAELEALVAAEVANEDG